MSKDRDTSVLSVLKEALEMERRGAAFFRDALQRVENPDAGRAIERLIDEEEDHVLLISRSIDALVGGECRDETVSAIGTRAPASYFDARARENFLRQISETPALPDLAVFDAAWRMEKEIMEFYEKAAERAEGPVRKVLKALYEFEKKHETFFKEYHDTRSELYARVYSERPWS